MKPLVSVIVPVYKVEKYLNKCVQSIVNQTYTNLEIILVDDGSPDNCPQMCDDWAEKDSRIKEIHQKNSGVSAARNAALDIANGEWVAFADSDDYVNPEWIEVLLRNAMQNGCELSICSVNFIYDKDYVGIRERLSKAAKALTIWSKVEAIHNVLSSNDIQGFSVNKLFKLPIIRKNHIQFNTKITIAEDLLFVCTYLQYCTKIVYTSEEEYTYVQHTMSALHKELFSKEYNAKWLTVFTVYQEIDKVISQDDTMSKNILNACRVRVASTQSKLMFPYPKWKRKRKELQQYVRAHLKAFLKSDQYSTKTKIGVLISAWFPGLGYLEIRRKFPIDKNE
ncbi:glycosyltransferase family 2 protein [Caproicibacterium lactatifermentans]|jgi:glycosyltransferase involved in cell wall biosynthesis|uniref:Glycosyltransferase n=1 Tax=Caproicibacterium lactatifermentans TaxID=2666138 RepID=A0A859DSC0_9FIRM|nr:glycosyltransferase family 2 protein [Caproicibacterium lactatifermentans]QKN23692.1 glycosyltransferase [Caproicibacterium lactatifermentans]